MEDLVTCAIAALESTKEKAKQAIEELGNGLISEFPSDIKLRSNPICEAFEKEGILATDEATAFLSSKDDTSEVGFKYFVEGMKRRFYLFLEEYNLGYLRSFSLTSSNAIRVEIGVSIHTPSFSKQKTTDEAVFKGQMEKLESVGINPKYSINHGSIPATAENFSAIENLLLCYGGTLFRYEVRKGNISNIKFFLKVDEFKRFEPDTKERVITKNEGDTLSEDEKRWMKECLLQVKDAISTIKSFPTIKAEALTSLFLSYNHAAKVVGVSNMITDAAESYTKKANEAISLAEAKKTEAFESLGSVDFSKTQKDIEKEIYDEMGLCVKDIIADENGVHFTMFLGDVPPIDSECHGNEWLQAKYETIATIRSSSPAIRACDENIEKISSFLRELYRSSQIDEIHIDGAGGFSIKSVDVSIRDMLDFAN